MDLFSSNTSTCREEILEVVDRKVSLDMNETLMADFNADEIKAALNSIGDIEVPGPDGMPSIVYKKYWDLMGEHITHEVLNVLNGGPFPEGWNDTTIVLIPKVKNPSRIKDLSL